MMKLYNVFNKSFQQIKIIPQFIITQVRKYSKLGLTYYYYEKYEKALEEFETAINFSDKSALIYKGLTLIALTRYQEALSLFDYYLQYDPNN